MGFGVTGFIVTTTPVLPGGGLGLARPRPRQLGPSEGCRGLRGRPVCTRALRGRDTLPPRLGSRLSGHQSRLRE